MIFLIRHGETDSNAARIVQTPDVPLSNRGVAQAERLAQRLAAEGVSAILSSDLRRAVMTAEHLHAATAAPIRFDAGLQERNFGDVRGQSYEAIGTNILSPTYEPPGGEGFAKPVVLTGSQRPKRSYRPSPRRISRTRARVWHRQTHRRRHRRHRSRPIAFPLPRQMPPCARDA
jgi:broad specificity phosphatase PhoE